MKRIISMYLALACFASAAWSMGPIRVVADPWAPFGGSELPAGGISLDVISTVLTRAGYKVETSIVPWERALNGARDGTFDVVGNLFYLAELEEYLAYGNPFYQSEVRFLRRVGTEHTFSDLESLRPYTIAVGAGYFYEDAFDKAEDLKKTTVTTVVQGVRMVASGRVDLTLDSVDVLNYVIAKEAPELSSQVEVMPTPLATRAIHMAIRKDHPDQAQIRADFNRVLSEMQNNGSLDELLAKHKY